MSIYKDAKKTALKARATCILRPSELSIVLCHRRRKGREQYLVRWRTESESLVPSRAIHSWHNLDDLSRALKLVQRYLDARQESNEAPKTKIPFETPPVNRKRKSPDSDPISRDPRLCTPAPSNQGKTDPTKKHDSLFNEPDGDVNVYNGVLQRKEGWISAKRSKKAHVVTINSASLPTPEMIQEAARTPTTEAERAIRNAFHRKVKRIPNLSLKNTIDSSTPSLDFTFIKDYALGDGVYRADKETFEGCQLPCKPNMFSFCGCEMPKDCACLEFAAVNESVLQREDPVRYEVYLRQKNAGGVVDTAGLPKRFPYHRAKGEKLPQTLTKFYRDERHPIYECNVNCNCGDVCKSRVVQKGRKVPLTIFKTPNRGWGVYSTEELVAGEFIDTYLGEIITNEEADRREAASGKFKASYLYSLDKFVGDDPELTAENCWVVDGQHMGGATRFINHSCEPNCRQYTVSYNKHDLRIFDLAFFAIEDIPPRTELTFDYMDKDEEEEEDVVRKREEAANDPRNLEKIPCNCGSRKCRGYLWV